MLWLISWLVYGLVVGLIAKAIHVGEDPVGFLPTIGIGVAGSYVGGLINFLLGRGGAFSTSGILMGIVGGVIFCWIYRKYRLNRLLTMQQVKETDEEETTTTSDD
ncbi:MAG: GlsB/YeaQ/YmgE family stress response membrane protein [Candidatus Thorarchaeota archaeon]|jgi:uncharacterized membrane protein YeaQ/YmgE (transglycosylase-associated protein family)